MDGSYGSDATDFSADDIEMILSKLNKIKYSALTVGGSAVYANLSPIPSRGGLETIVYEETPYDDTSYEPMMSTPRDFSNLYEY